MNTISVTFAQPLKDSITVQLLTDVSSAASGWYVNSAGLAVETWSAQTASIHPSAINGLDEKVWQITGRVWRESTTFRPRTPLGRRLWEIRERFIASGGRLLTEAEIEQEVAERRGERVQNSK